MCSPGCAFLHHPYGPDVHAAPMIEEGRRGARKFTRTSGDYTWMLYECQEIKVFMGMVNGAQNFRQAYRFMPLWDYVYPFKTYVTDAQADAWLKDGRMPPLVVLPRSYQ